ncbi:MAG TPA: L,D-transpeptidase family protein [Tepidisphaeraceae bacterium]|jgi:lipoprotein-anchoring transpeptidase ErfK/SrfK
MPRRSRFSKPLVFTLTAVVIAGAVVGVYSLLGSDPSVPVGQVDQGVAKLPGIPTPPNTLTKTPPEQMASMRIDPPPATQPTTKPAEPVKPAVKPAAGDPAALMAEADAKQKADDLLGARRLLVQAMDTKKLSPAQSDEVAKKLSEINEIVVFSNRKFNSDDTAVAHQVKPGENMQKIANMYDVTWRFIGRLNNISDPKRMQVGKSLKIIKGPFHAVVNKTHFTLDLYSGKPGEANAILIKRLKVGLGADDSTPTGEWRVDTKLENPRYYNPRNDGPRVIEPDDPANPLGERWIALVGVGGQAVGKTSYGIHGTIEPESIGKKKSMGCVRLLNEDVELVYDMLIKDKSSVLVVE